MVEVDTVEFTASLVQIKNHALSIGFWMDAMWPEVMVKVMVKTMRQHRSAAKVLIRP